MSFSKQLTFKKFKIEEMKENATILIVAKRGSGKSYLCRDLIYKLSKDIPCTFIISNTEKLNGFYEKFVPNGYIYAKYSTNITKIILSRQEQIREKFEKKISKGKFIDPRIIVIMDDCISDKKLWSNDEPLREIILNGRHFFITYILVSQDALSMKPELRGNFDYIFLLAEDFTNNLKRLYEHFTGMFPDRNTFIEVFNEITKDYGSMVIDKTSAYGEITDKVFYYKADVPPKKKVGSVQYQKINNVNYNPDIKKKNAYGYSRRKNGFVVDK